MKDKTVLCIMAMLCLVALEVCNMAVFGMDGTILTGVVIIIAGLAGYTVKEGVIRYREPIHSPSPQNTISEGGGEK